MALQQQLLTVCCRGCCHSIRHLPHAALVIVSTRQPSRKPMFSLLASTAATRVHGALVAMSAAALPTSVLETVLQLIGLKAFVILHVPSLCCRAGWVCAGHAHPAAPEHPQLPLGASRCRQAPQQLCHLRQAVQLRCPWPQPAESRGHGPRRTRGMLQPRRRHAAAAGCAAFAALPAVLPAHHHCTWRSKALSPAVQQS